MTRLLLIVTVKQYKITTSIRGKLYHQGGTRIVIAELFIRPRVLSTCKSEVLVRGVLSSYCDVQSLTPPVSSNV
jgi:hypothetical protein